MSDGYVITTKARVGGLGALWQRRGLLFSLTLREVQIRYRQALLGVLWAVAQPLVLMLVVTVVFHRILKVDAGDVPYPLFAFPGLVIWTFFHTAVTASVGSLVTNADLVRKIWFPREGLPLAAVFAVLPDLAAGLVLYLVLLVAWGVALTPALLALPLLVLILLATTLAWALLGAAVNVFFRDVKHALPFLLQVVFFVTPIVYPLSAVPERWRPFVLVNPLTAVVDGLRRVGVDGRWPDLAVTLPSVVVAGVLLLVAYAVFLRAERRFADIV